MTLKFDGNDRIEIELEGLYKGTTQVSKIKPTSYTKY